MSEKITKIQARWKGINSRDRSNVELMKKRFSDLVNKLSLRRIADKMTELAKFIIPIKNTIGIIGGIENRYSINNLFAFGNNAIRNLYFLKLTNKLCFAIKTNRLNSYDLI